MKKRLVALLLVIMFMVSVIGCGGAAPADADKQGEDAAQTGTGQPQATMNAKALEMQKILMDQLQPEPKYNQNEKIGVLVISLTNPFWVSMKEGYEKAAKELGVQVEVMAAPTEGDTKSQLETLDAMVAKNYQALVISPIEPNNLVPGIVKANEKGIKVINLGPGVNVDAVKEAGGKLDGKITVKFEDQGKAAAEYIVSKMGAEGGKVAIIQGIAGAGQSEGRTAGAKEVFENTDGVELVSIQPADWDRNKAYNITQNLIQAHPDLKGIFACNDVMALAAADALEAAGKREGITIFGVDFIEEAKEAMIGGKLDGSMGYSVEVYTKAALVLALKSIQGQDIPDVVYSPLAAVTKENVNEFENWK